MKISYYSLGCKVNLYESEAIINEFIDKGFTFANLDVDFTTGNIQVLSSVTNSLSISNSFKV